jgi:hypothetical protein
MMERLPVDFSTHFSLFKETPSSNLSVHYLVQEVILENLNPEEELQSIDDAIRMLHYAFRNCSSPDELLSSKKQERPSVVVIRRVFTTGINYVYIVTIW